MLQEGEIRRVGDRHWRKVDVRVVCATNRDLSREVEAERFLIDLFHRIQEFPLRLPSLRERREDIPRLAEHFGDLSPDMVRMTLRKPILSTLAAWA